MMNLLLLGYGKMGKAIEEIATDRGHAIVERIDMDNRHLLREISSEKVDAAIEFSQPDAAFENIGACLEIGVPVISGTTGWLDRKAEIEALCRAREGTFFYASNFSIGVNLFFKLNQYLAGLMRRYPTYGVEMTEIHHNEKKDAPSGTAISLVEGILRENTRFKGWSEGKADSDDLIGIISHREGQVPGTHQVRYHSDIDDIEIKHEAHSRKGFALGAVLVAEWIRDPALKGKPRTGVLSMDDFLEI